MKKKILAMSIVAMLCLFNIDLSHGITTGDEKIGKKPEITAKAALILDVKSGEVLFEKNSEDLREQASTTKIMTALLAAEKLSLDTVVTIDEETSMVEGSGIYLKPGEEITVRELLYGLMLKSANDAAVALAKAVGGTEENFAAMMNKKAKELGLENTNYKNASGLHADGHYTSAYDLALLSKAALRNDIVSKYGSTVKHTIPKTNKSEERKLVNTNHLLYDEKNEVEINGKLRKMKYEGVNGLKTGYTKEAGRCIAVTAKRGDDEYIIVILGSRGLEREKDAIKLLDWVFENYSSLYLMSHNDSEKIPVKKGKQEKTEAVLKEDVYISLPKGANKEKITHSIKAINNLIAPIEKDEHIADVVIYYENKEIKKVPLYADEVNERGGLISLLRSQFLLESVVIGSITVLIIVLAWLYSSKKRRIELQEEEERQKKALELEMEKLAENRKKFMNYK